MKKWKISKFEDLLFKSDHSVMSIWIILQNLKKKMTEFVTLTVIATLFNSFQPEKEVNLKKRDQEDQTRSNQ